MNDQLSGQLGGAIPAYARDLLWLESDSGVVKVEGGLFTLEAPAQVLTLRWGGANGPALTQLRWRADSLDWDGSVRIGGYIDAMHVTDLGDVPGTILHLGGQPLKPGITGYPTRSTRKNVPYPVPSFFDGVADEIAESVTTWIAFEDSPVLALAQDALVSKLAVYCFGQLADRWHEHFALPIVLEGITLFAP